MAHTIGRFAKTVIPTIDWLYHSLKSSASFFATDRLTKFIYQQSPTISEQAKRSPWGVFFGQAALYLGVEYLLQLIGPYVRPLWVGTLFRLDQKKDSSEAKQDNAELTKAYNKATKEVAFQGHSQTLRQVCKSKDLVDGYSVISKVSTQLVQMYCAYYMANKMGAGLGTQPTIANTSAALTATAVAKPPVARPKT